MAVSTPLGTPTPTPRGHRYSRISYCRDLQSTLPTNARSVSPRQWVSLLLVAWARRAACRQQGMAPLKAELRLEPEVGTARTSEQPPQSHEPSKEPRQGRSPEGPGAEPRLKLTAWRRASRSNSGEVDQAWQLEGAWCAALPKDRHWQPAARVSESHTSPRKVTISSQPTARVWCASAPWLAAVWRLRAPIGSSYHARNQACPGTDVECRASPRQCHQHGLGQHEELLPCTNFVAGLVLAAARATHCAQAACAALGTCRVVEYACPMMSARLGKPASASAAATPLTT